MTTTTINATEKQVAQQILASHLPPTREERKVLLTRFVKINSPIYPAKKAAMDIGIVSAMTGVALVALHFLRK